MIDLAIINGLLTFWFKPVCALSVVLLLTRWSNARSPHACHWELMALGSLTLILMPLSYFLPKIPIAILSPNLNMFSAQSTSIMGLNFLLIMLYAITALYSFIACFFLSLHCFDWFHARKLVMRSREIKKEDYPNRFSITAEKYVFKESTEIHVPVVWGARKPCVILPMNWQSWSEPRLKRVVDHEYAHIQRGDWLIKNIFMICRALFWFVPPLWLLVQRALNYAEYACDDYVVKDNDCRAEYAQDLLDLSVQKKLNASFVAISSSELACRLNLVLEGGRDRSQPNKIYKLAVVFSAVFILAPFYSLAINYKDVHHASSIEYIFHMSDVNARRANIKPIYKNVDIKEKDDVVFFGLLGETSIFYREKLPVFQEPIALKPPIIITDKEVQTINVDPLLYVDIDQPEIQMKADLSQYLISPTYPEKALKLGVEGRIRVHFDIDIEGYAHNYRFEKNPKNRFFQHEIESALKKSRFTPKNINGYAIALLNVEETYVFKISQSVNKD